MAWRDRRHDTRKDAIDLRTILLAGSHTRHLDALYDRHVDLLELYSFDPVNAAAHLLGVRARSLVENAPAVVTALLGDDDLVDVLSAAAGDAARTRELLHAYRRGWAETPTL